VLVLPGFTANDMSTRPLRWFLRGQGWWAHGWQLGRNMGPSTHVIDGMNARVTDLYYRHGRKVSLVGWSLGGVYARQLAREHPEKIRQVITLGSPFRMQEGDRSAADPIVEPIRETFDARVDDLLLCEDEKPALRVPSTAIYTRTDGVVRWHTCIDVESEYHENVEVMGSHSGLGHNPMVLYVVADRLAQPEGTWTKFQRPPLCPIVFPSPATWRAAAA